MKLLVVDVVVSWKWKETIETKGRKKLGGGGKIAFLFNSKIIRSTVNTLGGRKSRINEAETHEAPVQYMRHHLMPTGRLASKCSHLYSRVYCSTFMAKDDNEKEPKRRRRRGGDLIKC